MPILKKKPEEAEEHIPLPESSDEDEDSSSELSGDEHSIEDPFLEEDSDSDDAPEALSFKSAHENLLAQKKKTIEVLKVLEDEKRKKRKELHDQYMQQKIEKRQKIDGKLLSDDVLEELKDQPVLETADIEENSTSLDKEEEEKEEIDIVNKEIIEEHGPTLFKCKSLAAEDKKKSHIPENILIFKDRLLYEGRIRREKSSKDAVVKRKKQLAAVRISTNSKLRN